MEILHTILPYAQGLTAILLIASIILQSRGSSVGGAFGGSDDSNVTFYTRRGSEKVLFNASIILGALFALLAFAHLFV
jgi:protein translocase SecG subunit